ncbi:unnamed protein product [Alopecurus aequalis]
MEESWLNPIVQFFNSWAIRLAVLSSFAAHLAVILLAGVRRRKASGVRTVVLWLAYQLANWAAAYALGHMSLGSTTPHEQQQLVAFWASFLLQHLGGPDNISAYSIEDSQLSGRQAIGVVVQVVGAIYVLYKDIYIGGHGGVLLPASVLVLALGVAKYAEKALALRRGDLGNIRISISSSKKQQPTFTSPGFWPGVKPLDNEQALLVAHGMFPFCQRAMADSSIDMDSPDLNRSRAIFSLGWEDMCKVVEMELSLMYDILYTKAAMVHTWGGYFIRLVSPVATAAATILFCLYSKEGQRREDVIITYALLAATFLLDMRWLLRALGSTWTHAFLQARPRCWLHHAALCSGRWRRLRGVVASLDFLAMEPRPDRRSHYRLWSGAIGQYDLLHECTRDTASLCGRVAEKIRLEDGLVLSEDIRGLVFERVREILKSTYEGKGKKQHGTDGYSMRDITTSWGQTTTRRRHRNLKKFLLAFGREFQEDILVWHIATQVFLSGSRKSEDDVHAKAIKALSQYLMFLVAVRRHMVPGLALRSLYEVTRDALRVVWRNGAGNLGPSSSSSMAGGDEETLASILCNRKEANDEWGLDLDKTRLISDGADLAMELLSAEESSDMSQMLELVFNVWVDKLLYAGTRCSRESHAKQLSRGGELTTIVWIMAEHAGPFRIGQFYVPYPEEKKKSEEEKKKKEKETYVSMPPPGKPEEVKPTETRRRTRKYATLYPVY